MAVRGGGEVGYLSDGSPWRQFILPGIVLGFLECFFKFIFFHQKSCCNRDVPTYENMFLRAVVVPKKILIFTGTLFWVVSRSACESGLWSFGKSIYIAVIVSNRPKVARQFLIGCQLENLQSMAW